MGEGNADRDGVDRTNIGEDVGVRGEANVGAGVHEQVCVVRQESICGGILTGDKLNRSPEGGDSVGVMQRDGSGKRVRWWFVCG